jgi:hypothetical protein
MNDRTIPLEAQIALVRQKLGKAERRRHKRYRCSLATTGKLYFPVTGDGLTVWVSNLSVGGAGLNSPQPLEEGADVIVTLKVTSQRAVHRVPARVVHVTEEADGSWRIGCEFAEPLAPDVMESLL